MNSLFVSASGFLALVNHSDKNHKVAKDFLSSLFSQTVRIFTSQTELINTVNEIEKELGLLAAEDFIKKCENGGIVILPEVEDLIYKARDLQVNLPSIIKPKPLFSHAIVAATMYEYGFRDVFSFDESLKHFALIVWPH